MTRLCGYAPPLPRDVSSIASASTSAMCITRGAPSFPDSLSRSCRMHPEHPVTTASGFAADIAPVFLSAIFAEISGKNALKTPPMPQQ